MATTLTTVRTKEIPFNEIVNPRGWYVSDQHGVSLYVLATSEGFYYFGANIADHPMSFCKYTESCGKRYDVPYRPLTEGDILTIKF